MSICSLYLEKYAPKIGYYIEIGAYNGKSQNSTIVLEKAGWDGVCVEALPDNFRKLKKNRNCKCIEGAVYNRKGSITFVDVGTPGWSGIKETHQDKHKQRYNNENYTEITVPCITFDSVAEKTDIDYLQIDVEGAEIAILNSINWNKFNIKHLCIEDNLKVERQNDDYSTKLTCLGYMLVEQLNKDFLYEKIQ